MEWKDEGIFLGAKRHGEDSAILEAMTEKHGRHLGLVRGVRSRRLQGLLQTGDSAILTWRARLEEHLGSWKVEPTKFRAASMMNSASSLFALQLVSSHLRLLPEREPHEALYRAVCVILDSLGDSESTACLAVRFELALLEALGFGLELNRCAASGKAEGLAWVSPRTGRAVGREAGEPWAEAMLKLPAFLSSESAIDSEALAVPLDEQIRQGFALTGFFLSHRVWSARGLVEPHERSAFIRSLG